MSEVEKLYKPQEIAELLSVSPRTIKRYCEEGAFPGAFKTKQTRSGHWRIPESGLKAYYKDVGREWADDK